jgi:uncharacterized protein YggE
VSARIASIALAALLVSGIACVPAASAEGRTVSVIGMGAVPFTPDFVILEFSVITRAEAYAEAQAANLAAVEAALRTATGRFKAAPADVATLGYSLSELISYDEGKERREGYVATTRMSIKLRDIASYRPLITALLDDGVNAVDSVSFGADDLASLREKALAAAYADAERKARAIALASRAKLGPLLSFREGEGPASVGPLAAKLAIRAAGNGEVISSGTTLVEAQAYVEFSIK